MNRHHFKSSLAATAIGLVAMFAALAPAPAAAAPQLNVQLQHNTDLPFAFPIVRPSDERFDYRIMIENTAPEGPPSVGDKLTCIGAPPNRTWAGSPTTGRPAMSFAYQWLRNGVPIIGAISPTYTTSAGSTTSPATTTGDAGGSLQCVVTGTVSVTAKAVSGKTPREIVSVSSAVTSQPPVVVSPQPAVSPPVPSSATVAAARPTVSGTLMAARTCSPPTNWTAGTSFAYQWLRNGAPIAGATSATYTPVEPSDNNKILQCEVIGTNAGPDATPGISLNSFTGTLESPATECGESCGALPSNGVNQTPFVPPANAVVGPLSVELELPGGQVTHGFTARGSNWSCQFPPASGTHHAMAFCTRTTTQPLSPQSSEPLDVVVAIGPDLPAVATGRVTVSGGGTVAPVSAVDSFETGPALGFGLSDFESSLKDAGGTPSTKAGAHPLEGVAVFAFNRKRRLVPFSGDETSVESSSYSPIGNVKQLFVDLPRGQVGNPLAVPVLCPTIEALANGSCPDGSRVGLVMLLLTSFSGEGVGVPIYAIQPEFGTPAQFAFKDPTGGIYTITARLRASAGYAVTLEVAPSPMVSLLRAKATICDYGVIGTQIQNNLACVLPGAPEANQKPLFTNPTRCGGPPPVVGASLNSWQNPFDVKHAEFTLPQMAECEAVPFQPQSHLEPTNRQADSPTGLEVSITMPTNGVEGKDEEGNRDPAAVAQANLDTAKVIFPEGMSINPASADGLGACSESQIKLGSDQAEQCPESSKVGTVEIDTPLIEETLTGNIYVAQQTSNPFKSTIGLYMAFSSKKNGITIKVAGKLVPNPRTGQLESVFTENPEDPFSRLTLKFNSGPRAPLVNPPKCGTYAIHSEFSPWSAASPANPTPAEIVSQDSTFKITEGPGGGPCPTGALEPKLKAALQNPQAGSKSTFNLTLSREDGSQRFTGLNVITPKGLTAYLKGIPYCPDAVLAGISSSEETGRPELEHPACPAVSRVGTVLSGAGAGPFPFQAPGRVYLAGPYKGAPVSLAVVAPAVAGPFDLGNVVIRNGLYIDPVTAQVTAKSDPIPTILHGILLDVRQIRLALDRPNFTAAPTSCASQQVVAEVKGEGGGSATAAVPFGVNGCENLAFKPKLALNLFGGTKRGAHPKLRAVVTYPPGDGYANIAGASVALPHSEFLDQAHIRTICTRVQFAAKACPPGAIYGHAEATTPLLDQPLSGPVYLRSSDNPLPDLVAALRGPDSQPIEVVLDGRIDSVHGGIRTTFESVPDQPVSSFVLQMQGGKKGLLVNSRDICKTLNKATANFSAQNGMTASQRPVLKSSCKKQAKKHRHRRTRHH